MTKSQVATAPRTRYRDLQVASPIKKPRTQTTKGRMLKPVALSCEEAVKETLAVVKEEIVNDGFKDPSSGVLFVVRFSIIRLRDKVDLISAECNERIDALKQHFSTVIYNMLAKLQSLSL